MAAISLVTRLGHLWIILSGQEDLVKNLDFITLILPTQNVHAHQRLLRDITNSLYRRTDFLRATPVKEGEELPLPTNMAFTMTRFRRTLSGAQQRQHIKQKGHGMLTVREDGRITVNNEFVIGKLNIYLPMNQHFSWESIFVVFVANPFPMTLHPLIISSVQRFEFY